MSCLICFYGELTKITLQLSPNTLLICSTGNVCNRCWQNGNRADPDHTATLMSDRIFRITTGHEVMKLGQSAGFLNIRDPIVWHLMCLQKVRPLHKVWVLSSFETRLNTNQSYNHTIHSQWLCRTTKITSLWHMTKVLYFTMLEYL